mgnify:CR=1 FL=1
MPDRARWPGSAGLGTAFGERKAIELLTEAYGTGITATPAPGDPRAACSSPPGRDEAERQPVQCMSRALA